MQVFRSHDTVPASITSPALRSLAQEWVTINATAEHHRQVAQLGVPGCSRPGDVLDLIDAADDVTANDLLYRLVMHDSYLSSRMALQAVMPRVFKVARGRATFDGHFEDHLQALICEVWETIASYPEHRTNHVALNLTRTRALDRTGDSLCAPVAEFFDSVIGTETDDDTPERELDWVLHAGLHSGAVSEADVELLLEVYVQGYSATEAAERRNMTSVAVRKRCERIRTRLAAAGA